VRTLRLNHTKWELLINMKSRETHPLISIITVCYNSVDFIEQTIKSVVLQEFDDYEYIIIDGGSNDGTLEIIEKYKSHLAYYHSKPDKGIVDAFNQGLTKANGEWIVFLNSDDQYCDNKVLSDMARTLRENKSVDLIYGQIQITKREREVRTVSGFIGSEWEWSSFRTRMTIPHPSSFTNKEYFNKHGVFDESFSCAMDYELYLRAGSQLRAKFIPRLLVWMRDGGMSKFAAFHSYKESRDAQVKQGALGFVEAWYVYTLYVVRKFFSNLLGR